MAAKGHPRARKLVRASLGLAWALACSPALAERPMNVDDAGTVGLGGIEVQFGAFRDDRHRGFDGSVGYGITDTLQLELGFGHGKDRDPSPDEDRTGVAVAAKWVPLTAESGLSAGMSFELAREKAEDGANVDDTAEIMAVTLLASWLFDAGLNAHLNLGRTWVEVDGDTEAENGWGLGADYGLTERLAITAEVFGSQHGAPDKAIGLRYVIKEGVKISGAIGRGNDRSFANFGVLLAY